MPKTMPLALALFLCGTVSSQRTWVVDAAGGPGHDFTSLAPAVTAAQAGDVILMRSGDYRESALTVTRGISLIGGSRVNLEFNTLGIQGLIVDSIPAGERFAMRGIDVGGFASTVLARNCAGLVTFREMTGTLGSLGIPDALSFSIQDCEQVHLHSLFLRGGGRVSFERSRGSMTLTNIEGEGFGALSVTDSDVVVDRATITTGAFPFGFLPPVVQSGGELTLSRCNVEQRIASAALGAIQSSNGALVVDPTVTLQAPTGQAVISGSSVVTTREALTLTPIRSGGGVTFSIQGPTAATYAVVASFPAPTTQLPFGEVWVDLGLEQQVIVDVGLLNGRDAAPLVPTAGLPRGLVLTVQCGAASPGGAVEFSNGIAVFL